MNKLFVLFLAFAAAALRADVEFSGFFLTPKDSFFALTDLETKRASGWLKTGQAFAGYTIVGFDGAHDVLTVERDGRPRQLPLRESKIQDGRAMIRGTITVMNETMRDVHATLFFDEESVFPLSNGVVFKLKPSRHPDGNIRYDAKFITREKDGSERVIAAPSVIALPGKPFGIRIGETPADSVGFSFTP